jgi:hypothetical protein
VTLNALMAKRPGTDAAYSKAALLPWSWRQLWLARAALYCVWRPQEKQLPMILANQRRLVLFALETQRFENGRRAWWVTWTSHARKPIMRRRDLQRPLLKSSQITMDFARWKNRREMHHSDLLSRNCDAAVQRKDTIREPSIL